MIMRWLACIVLLFPAPALAQYYDYAPATPSVELNLDVLGGQEAQTETNAESGMLKLRPPAVTRIELEPPAQVRAPVRPSAPKVSAPRAPAPKAPAPAVKKTDGPRLLKPFFTSQEDDSALSEALDDRVRLHTEPKAREEREKELAEALKREEAERKKTAGTPPPAMPAPAAVPSASDLSIEFPGNASEIAPGQAQKLEAAARQLAEMTDTRLQVRAYATGEDGNAGSARRISLSRALAVRGWLMEHGIKPNRVDVRALGAQADRAPLDRVDLVFVR